MFEARCSKLEGEIRSWEGSRQSSVEFKGLARSKVDDFFVAFQTLCVHIYTVVTIIQFCFGLRGGILDTLSDMKEKAEATLSDARTAEMKAQHGSVALD